MQGAAAAILDGAGRILLICENYDRRRYGFPGGAVEPGETALDAVVREVREETGVEVEIEHVVGAYRSAGGVCVTVFRCSIAAGTPAVPATGEIAEVGWFDPRALPSPVTNALHHALEDVLAGTRGVVRDGLPRVS